MTTTPAPARSAEKTTLLATLARCRAFLLQTSDGLTDEQARLTPTVSTLCLGALVKHVSATEEWWIGFVLDPTSARGDVDWNNVDWAAVATTPPEEQPEWLRKQNAEFVFGSQETLEGLRERYAQVAARTEEVIDTLATLDEAHDLPEAPWFEPGARWSARDVLAHLIAETAQHSGHADIIRESIDGARTMG